ncbi:CLUMA_CG018307, isoform A [Clunio marinus]|uniref:CLUMA_CG018307, isoform A n=1 Tax=Clunio marinus TaxID=568069 RepID=A0A1J1IXV2_9DIPT|nr:CLUMA_CG018307, isoform A [Clunio marinus]
MISIKETEYDLWEKYNFTDGVENESPNIVQNGFSHKQMRLESTEMSLYGSRPDANFSLTCCGYCGMMIKPQDLAKHFENRHFPPSLMDDEIIQDADPMFVTQPENEANERSQIMPPTEPKQIVQHQNKKPRKTTKKKSIPSYNEVELVHNTYTKSKEAAPKATISPPTKNSKSADYAFKKPNCVVPNNIVPSAPIIPQYGMLVKRTNPAVKASIPFVKRRKLDNLGSFNGVMEPKKILHKPAERIIPNVPKHVTNDKPKGNLVMKIKKIGNGNWKVMNGIST